MRPCCARSGRVRGQAFSSQTRELLLLIMCFPGRLEMMKLGEQLVTTRSLVGLGTISFVTIREITFLMEEVATILYLEEVGTIPLCSVVGIVTTRCLSTTSYVVPLASRGAMSLPPIPIPSNCSDSKPAMWRYTCKRLMPDKRALRSRSSIRRTSSRYAFGTVSTGLPPPLSS